jgi:uncharacterized protein YkwD
VRRLAGSSVVALLAVVGCGGGGSDKPATPPTSSSSVAAGIVKAEPTKGVLGPAITVVNGKVRIFGRTRPLSPKEDRPTDAQQNGVAAAGRCTRTAAIPARSNLRAVSSAILCLLNAERAAKGVPPLRSNRKLRKASRSMATLMVRQHFFAHDTPDGRGVLDRVKPTGYVRGNWVLGENLAWGSGGLATPRAIVNGWMHSPPHRANILYSKFRDIGIGIRLGAPGTNLSGGATYVTDFGRHS